MPGGKKFVVVKNLDTNEVKKSDGKEVNHPGSSGKKIKKVSHSGSTMKKVKKKTKEKPHGDKFTKQGVKWPENATGYSEKTSKPYNYHRNKIPNNYALSHS